MQRLDVLSGKKRVLVFTFAVIAASASATKALADHAYWGEYRSGVINNDSIMSGADLIPVTFRSSSPQVDAGALVRSDADSAYGAAGLVVRSTFDSNVAQGFVLGCNATSGCRGEFARSNGRIKRYTVNQDNGQGRFNGAYVNLAPASTAIQIYGAAPSAQDVTILLDSSNPHADEDDATVAFYGRIQSYSTSGAFTIQFPNWIKSVVNIPGTSIVTEYYSVSEVEHPSGSSVHHYTISGTNKGICAVYVSECPDP